MAINVHHERSIVFIGNVLFKFYYKFKQKPVHISATATATAAAAAAAWNIIESYKFLTF